MNKPINDSIRIHDLIAAAKQIRRQRNGPKKPAKAQLDVTEYLEPPELLSFIRFMRRQSSKRKSRAAIQNCTMAEILALAGLRASELCHLTLADVPPLRGDGTLRVVNGKGGKTRLVNIPPDLTTTIDHWVRVYRKQIMPTHYLFVTRNNKPYSHVDIWKRSQVWFREWRESGTAPDREMHLSPHSLRHSYASRYLHINGSDALAHLQMQLGHSDIKTTMIYARTTSVDNQRFAANLTIGD